ncbi:MAG: BCAM0308 family protein [Candidatus Bipolaricaulota bacterium]|nr:BCAM0308 family protein [Candidatus Bipolaricaulota bacterium]
MVEGEKRGAVGRASKDPYSELEKYPEPTVCPRCGLVYRAGRWQVAKEPPTGRARESHCPACRREIDRMPAGLLGLSGDYLAKHRDEILNIARNQAASVAATRPLQRILWIEEKGGSIEIATTNPHLALRIGRAIRSACKGELTVKQAERDSLVRAYWERES